MRYKVVVLDFDGTLVESVGIKDQAFREVFSEFPEYLDAIMEYHTSHNHTIRFEKFRFIYESILHRPYSDEIAANLSRRFSESVFAGIVACPWVVGAQEFLTAYREVAPLYLVSMSPGEELRDILKARGMLDVFVDVYASDWTKEDAILDILAKEDAGAGEAVYVGDTLEDERAATSCGLSFVGRDSGKAAFAGACADMHAVRDVLEKLG